MNANEFAEFVMEVIKGEPEKIVDYIKNEDWQGMKDEFFYAFCNAAEG